MNVATNLESSAFYFPQQPALSETDSEITYGALNERVNCIATGLINMGIRQGEHVGICAPNSSDWIAFYFGVLKAGAVAVTYSSLLSQDELILLVFSILELIPITAAELVPFISMSPPRV